MWLRSQKERVGIDELSDEELDRAGGISLTSPDAIMEKQELNHTVMQAISALPENHRLVVTLYYLDEMSYQEISDFLGTPMNTIKSWLHRAKTRLRKEILEMVPEMFATQKIGQEFTEKVEKAICERYEEKIEGVFDVKGTDVIVVCPELRNSRIHIEFWDEQQIQISGRKVLLGATVKEATQRKEARREVDTSMSLSLNAKPLFCLPSMVTPAQQWCRAATRGCLHWGRAE